MFNEDFLADVIKEALNNGGDFADVFVEYSEVNSISCEEDKIEQVLSGLDAGAGLRIIRGEEVLYGSTNDLSQEGLLTLAKELSATRAPQKKPKAPVFTRDESLIFVSKSMLPVLRSPATVAIRQKIDLVNSANSVARKFDSRITQVSVDYADKIKNIEIMNSFGLYKQERRVYTVFTVHTVAEKKGLMQTGYKLIGGLEGFELFDEYNVNDVAAKSADIAVRMLSAKKAPTGRMPVILASEAGGTMIHEAIGHSLEADLVQKGISQYSGKLGEKVASELITVIDDATLPKKRGSFAIDDEGTPAQRTVLVEKGVLQNYLYDQYTARKDKRVSTGNGRRESYRFKPIPRMSNTYIASGKQKPDDIISSIDTGLYVKKMGGGQVNTTNGDFVFEVSEGYEVKKGKIGSLVRGATLIGNGPNILKLIDMVGNDLDFDMGTCGKDGQHVPVGDGQPTVRIKEITVGGTGS
ncbi:MAG: TldD/PmbA family protein [bacterium]